MSLSRNAFLVLAGALLLSPRPPHAQTAPAPVITLPPLDVTGAPRSRTVDDLAAPATVLAFVERS